MDNLGAGQTEETSLRTYNKDRTPLGVADSKGKNPPPEQGRRPVAKAKSILGPVSRWDQP